MISLYIEISHYFYSTVIYFTDHYTFAFLQDCLWDSSGQYGPILMLQQVSKKQGCQCTRFYPLLGLFWDGLIIVCEHPYLVLK